MNWTEGNLSRHSRGRQRNELLTRQKQHFAKVRNNHLKSGHTHSPVSISFLGAQHSRDLGRRDGSGSVAYKLPSSPLLKEKRKRFRGSPSDQGYQVPSREKRKSLLDKEDWVGLSLQQPIDITFPGQVQASTGSRWSKVGHPRAYTTRKRREYSDASQLGASYDLNGPPLKIQIGSQEILPSVGTLSQSGTKRYNPVAQPATSLPRRRSDIASSPELSQTKQPYVVPKGNQPLQIPKDERNGKAREQGTTYLAPIEKAVSPEEPTHIVYSSSIIHEPTPLRADCFTVLRWTPSGSEDQDSMQVEIERPARSLPSSQEADQEVWKNWVSTSPIVQPVSSSAKSPIAISSVSSRTSGLPSHLQRRLPSYDISSEAEINTNYLDPVPNTDGQEPQSSIHENGHLSPQRKSGDHQRKAQSSDDNDIWMKFAFSCDSDELEAQVFAEAVHQAAAELLPSDTPPNSNDTTETLATYGDNSFVSNADQDESIPSGYSDGSQIAMHGTAASESAPSNIATAGSTSIIESEPRFRFVQPRTFIGKLAGLNGAAVEVSPFLSHSKKRRGRPKKRTSDGRTDIRRLPDFDGDPIEEFDD
ncbi:uncharacterized protein F4812DRAFT_452036 [Daldinia caldariorum]|uniref:uncharacterized protein n=1 Tax=Daldinia caldariorum TaxID=326644 RepID=UPI0020082820|nr:uncharacterized protein F4812DRAFT_452036 [Daldinia caldariorum]KAI1466102.1 hypothetical protein F4812DRAFT_452036 [Daldinia caldariorum]